MTPQAEDSARLQELLAELYANRADRTATRSAVFGVILERLRCARVSMWKLDQSGDELTLLCFASKTAGGPYDTSERRLRRIEFMPYFDALVQTGAYVSVDTMSDPVLAPMREAYLVPDRVASRLDVACVLNDRIYGVVCCEENERREWKAVDVVALRAIVNRVSLLMWNAPDSLFHDAPSLPLRTRPEPEPSVAFDRRR